jgi:hypothetical protein
MNKQNILHVWIRDGIGSNSEKRFNKRMACCLHGDAKNMRKSLKIASVATVLFLALGIVVLAYANSQNTLNASYDEQWQSRMQNMQTFLESNNYTIPEDCTMHGHMRHMPQGQANGFPWTERFLENATLSTVQGTVVSEFKGMLILNTDAGQVRVLLPKEWAVDNEVVGRASLFNGTFASAGQNVTVKVLESELFSNANFSLNVMMGYEAINATGTHAYAVLPFNIQPSS